VNGDTPLQDISGGRRFLPVAAPNALNLQWLSSNIRQIIAEAATLEAAGETFAMPEEVYEVATQHQEAARAVGDVEEAIGDWFSREGNFYILAADVARALRMVGLKVGRYGSFMKKLGWHSVQHGPTRTRMWVRGGKVEECLSMEPSQQQVNGRVEMRIKRGAWPLPPLPY